MIDFKINRWATYLVPGFISTLAIAFLVFNLKPYLLELFLNSPTKNIVSLSVGLLILSYVFGIGLWGAGYIDWIRDNVGIDSHLQRTIEFNKTFAKSENIHNAFSDSIKRCIRYWIKKEEVQHFEIKKRYKDYKDCDFDKVYKYDDFTLALIGIHHWHESPIRERVIREWEMLGLLQSLSVATIILGSISLFNTVFIFFHYLNPYYKINLFWINIILIIICTLFLAMFKKSPCKEK